MRWLLLFLWFPFIYEEMEALGSEVPSLGVQKLSSGYMSLTLGDNPSFSLVFSSLVTDSLDQWSTPEATKRAKNMFLTLSSSFPLKDVFPSSSCICRSGLRILLPGGEVTLLHTKRPREILEILFLSVTPTLCSCDCTVPHLWLQASLAG